MNSSHPRSIEPEEIGALGLEGRLFASREGLSHFRGVVRRAAFEPRQIRIERSEKKLTLICVEGAEVERRREGESWAPHEDVVYLGNPLVTTLFMDGDGKLKISIMYVGQITILPARA